MLYEVCLCEHLGWAPICVHIFPVASRLQAPASRQRETGWGLAKQWDAMGIALKVLQRQLPMKLYTCFPATGRVSGGRQVGYALSLGVARHVSARTSMYHREGLLQCRSTGCMHDM